MPQSAFFSAGASFTPSPVMPTMWPRCCRTSTMWNLCSGNTWAKPSAFSISLAAAAVSLRLTSPRPEASRMSVPIPSVLAVSRAMARASPGDHLDLDAHLPRGGDGRLGVLPRRVEEGQHAEKLPLARSLRSRATPSERKPRAANSFDRPVDVGLHLPGVGRQFQDHLGRALGHLERRAVRGLDGGLGAFADGVERLEVHDVVAPQRLLALQAAQHGEVDRVVVVVA